MNPQYIKINMVPNGVVPVLYCSQYDVGRPLGMVVYNGSETVDLDDYTVTFEATRTDGTAITAAITTDGNVCALETTATMTNKADRYPAQIVVADGNGKRIASIPIKCVVISAAMDEDAEGVEEDRSLYQQYTGTVQSLIADIRTQLNAETAARQAAVSAEASARQAADNQLQSNINAEASTRATQDASLQSQINQLVAPSGEAPSAAEVENARVGADGTVYSTLGDAIRTQVTDVKSAISAILEPISYEIAYPGKYVSYDTGAFTNSANYGSTGYVNIERYSVLRYMRVVATTASPTGGMAFYDKYGNYVSGFRNVANGSALALQVYECAVPDNAVYAAFSIPNDFASSFTLHGYKETSAERDHDYYDFGQVNPKGIKVRCNAGAIYPSLTGTKIRCVYKVSADDLVIIKSDTNTSARIYSSVSAAIKYGSDQLATLRTNRYGTTKHVCGFAGFLSITFVIDGDTPITDADFDILDNGLAVWIIRKDDNFLMNYQNVLDMVGSEISIPTDIENGTMANASNTNAVNTANYISIEEGDTVTCVVTKPLKAATNYYAYGYRTYDASKAVLRDETYGGSTTGYNTIKALAGEKYVRFTVCEFTAERAQIKNRAEDFSLYPIYVTVSAETVKRVVDSVEDRLRELEKKSTSVLNADLDDSITALTQYNTFDSGNRYSATGVKALFSFAAITDIHGSQSSIQRFVDYCNDKKDYIDVAMCFGDTVIKHPSENSAWYDDAIAGSKVPFLYVVGNHDTSDTGDSGITQADARTKWFSTIETEGWLDSTDFMGEGKASWYKDFTDYGIRVIALFEYGNSTTVASGAPASYCRRWFDSDTLQWFADTLYSTPTGYHVIVLLHQMPYYPIDYVECDFTQTHDQSDISASSFLNTVDGNPIEEIVNAFMTSTSISKTYESIASYQLGKTATVAKDFSNRAEDGIFVGYFHGHLHRHAIFASQTYPSQKAVGLPSGSTNLYQRHWDDTPYDRDTRNADSFYFVSIDTSNRKICLMKIGGHMTKDFRKRKIMALTY